MRLISERNKVLVPFQEPTRRKNLMQNCNFRKEERNKSWMLAGNPWNFGAESSSQCRGISLGKEAKRADIPFSPFYANLLRRFCLSVIFLLAHTLY